MIFCWEPRWSPRALDFEKVTLVGVLGIDSLLFGQGFRACESVFSLITQVVGRGGRAALPGRALIQTTVPDHPVFAAGRRAGLQGRSTGKKSPSAGSRLYPPFCSFVRRRLHPVTQEGAVFHRSPAVWRHCWVSTSAAKARHIPLRMFRPRADEHYDAQQQIPLQADAEMPQ